MNTVAKENAGWQKEALSAIITSQISGLIMAVVVMAVFTVFLGKGPIYPVQVIGSVAFGQEALTGFHLGAFLAGLVVHQSVALAWGLVFAMGATWFEVRAAKEAAVLGVIVAVISMIDTYLFVPAVMENFHGVDIWNREVPIFWNWAAHIVFGAGFYFYPKILSKLESL